MAAQLHYLTVQDILWINLQVTDKVNHYNFAKLEEATYYQYAYGESKNVIPQAARLLTGFNKMSPIDGGNDETNFIACLTFLKINGLDIVLDDARGASWYESVQSRSVDASEAVKSMARPSHDHHEGQPDIRKTIKDLIVAYPQSLAALKSAIPV